jgi:RNA polymerase sigma-70 factor (ECF subfamily)
MLSLQESLNAMDPLDRDVLALRHFEHLTLSETAAELGIAESVAAKRYILALKQLKQMLAGQ